MKQEGSSPGLESSEALRSFYGTPSERAVLKEMTALDVHCRNFISLCPFVVMATVGADGRLDCSPRGDGPGFVSVIDEKTLAIPDRKGNNRVDSLSNIIEHPRVGLLFMVPGMNETLRVNGPAVISQEPELLRSMAVRDALPRSALVVTAEEVFLQCAKALVRSHLWEPAAQIDRSSFPSMGQMLADQIGGVDAAKFDKDFGEMVKTKKGLY